MISDQLKQAIQESGLTAYEIAKRATEKGHSIDSKAVSRFVSGQRGLNMDTFTIIAEVLDLTLVKKGEPSPSKPPVNYHEMAHAMAAKMAMHFVKSMAKVKFNEVAWADFHDAK